MVAATIFFTFLSAFALSKPLPRSLQVHEARDGVPSGYILSGPAPPDKVLPLRIVLVQSDTTGLVDALYDVSTPSSAKYGLHLTKGEVETFVAPRPGSVTAVNNWHWPADCPDSVIFHPRRVEGTP
ncbi:hypothetical protein AcV5_002264 [Taiwanofungus camphoratus]|nr:hypothetical protein AcV5_002264 [Antrodia cinnamomea]